MRWVTVNFTNASHGGGEGAQSECDGAVEEEKGSERLCEKDFGGHEARARHIVVVGLVIFLVLQRHDPATLAGDAVNAEGEPDLVNDIDGDKGKEGIDFH